MSHIARGDHSSEGLAVQGIPFGGEGEVLQMQLMPITGGAIGDQDHSGYHREKP